MRIAPIVLLCLSRCLSVAAGPITTTSLINEAIDMNRLTRFPAPAYDTVQFSSTDHRSIEPGGRDWYANSDGFGKEPVPNFEAVLRAPEGDGAGEYLICDVPGPGAIVRLWTARIGGTIRMYLDESETPVYDGPAEDFFLRPYNAYLSGTGLSAEDFNNALYQRNAAYTPFPFAKHCRITWEGRHDQIHFYEVQVRRYAPDAEVRTFSPDDLKMDAEIIRQPLAVLANIDEIWPYRSARAPIAVAVDVPAHDMAEAFRIDGPAAIERLTLRVEAADLDRALRQTVLHVQCDGAPWGQVQAPVGDFFGAGPGVNPYTSVPFSVTADGTMTCRYVMPCRESLRVLFENRGDQPVKITGAALPADYAWDEASMHFRARWRIDHGLVASGAAEMGVQDLPFLIARGQGMYVGTAVMLLNPNEVPSSGGNWWGEGDEKIFVDGDTRPSTFGTGSEDYFNYAWSATDLFTFPYCGQPRNDGPANRGFVVNYRWHILDALPFDQSIAFYMELFSHERTPGYSYGRIAYHYAKPGVMDDHVPLTDEDLRTLALPPTWEPAARGGASDSAFFACEDLAPADAAKQFAEGGLWQGGRCMIWTPAAAGEELTLTFNVAEDGRYDLAIACRYAPDGGTIRARIDAKEPGDPIALTSAYRVFSSMAGLGREKLKAGTHTLTLTAVDAGKPVGLDFLQVKKK